MKRIFECVVGSTAYGTNLPTSDIDIKGVYVQPDDDIVGLKYKEQINPDKDTSYYEIRRFVELLGSANPTMLEMLFVDPKFIRVSTPAFEIVRENRHKFLTTQCANSFGGYAIQQIKRAKGLNKKMNWERERIERKTVLDFCTFCESDRPIPIEEFLTRNALAERNVGLAKLDKMPNCYAVYYSVNCGFKGIASDESNDVKLSSIPKGQLSLGVLHFNKDAYSIHCKEYREYNEWLVNRNTDRYVDTLTHGQQIDGKNIAHCVRLLDCAIEIAETRNLSVLRPNRDELLKIRKGECDLQTIIEQCEEKIGRMDELFSKSNLPTKVDREFQHNLILEVRNNITR